MSNWSISFTKDSEKELEDINSSVRQRIIEKIEWLEANSDFIFHKELSRDLKDCYKLRVGNWRVIYTMDAKSSKIVIIKIDHRSRIYKKK